MLCCVGLVGGMAVGQYLGGPWTFVAPAAGFGLGLVADMKFMKHHHGAHHDQAPRPNELPLIRKSGTGNTTIQHQAQSAGKT